MRSVWHAHIVATCALLASCSDSKEPAKSSAENSETAFSEVDSVIAQFLNDNHLPGATAVVVHRDKGQVHQRGYGEFDKDRVQ